jgi:hypothetical protein
MTTDDPADLLRTQLHAVRDAVPAPAAAALTEGALRRARGIRTRRRATFAGVALAGVAAVAVVAPGAGPSPMPGPATPGPTTASSQVPTVAPLGPPPKPSPTWRVTERCDPARLLCQDLPVDALEVDGATYRVRSSGAQPWGARGHAIQLSVGQRGAVHQVLGGVVGRSGDLSVRASFDVYVDGRPARHYEDAPLTLLRVGAGRHHVKVVALGDPVAGASVVVGDFAPSP